MGLMRLILPVSNSESSNVVGRSLRQTSDVAYTRAWPTSTPEAAEALTAAAETHKVNPLPAYDQNGVVIEPQFYTRRLEGATVIIRFELYHYLIRNGKNQPATDTFSARVFHIRVILPPPGASPATPRKRRVLPRDDYFGSFTPTKRHRDGDDDDSSKENRRPSKLIRWVFYATSHYFTDINQYLRAPNFAASSGCA